MSDAFASEERGRRTELLPAFGRDDSGFSHAAEDGDRDVALMVARFAGASLGLLAFTITVIAGLYVRNPVDVILSRSVLALFVFCLIGFLLGGAAQLVVAEFEKGKVSEIRKRYDEEPVSSNGAEHALSENVGEGESVGA